MKFPHRLELDGAWCEVDVHDTTLVTRVCKAGGTPRTTEKKLGSATEARTAAYKKISEQLKKGLVYRDRDAMPGEARMRFPLNRPYTGDLSLACRGSDVLFAGVRASGSSSDLCRVSAEERVESIAELPDPAPFNLLWVEANDSLYARTDKGLLRVDMTSRAVECTPQKGGMVRALSVGGDRLLVRTQAKVTDSESTLQVLELGTNRVVFETRCFTARAQLTLDAQLSPDGSLVAYCTAEGRFTVARVDDGHVLASFESYPMLGLLQLHPSRPWLLGAESNGSGRLFVYDFGQQRDETMHFVVEREPDAPMPHEGHRMILDVMALAFSPSGASLALLQSGRVEVYGLDSGRREQTVPLWAARNAELRFTSESELVVRTNAGLIEWVRVR